MANISASESRRHLSINAPHQISKDAQGPDTSIPLSPQWLLPKPGESRLGMGTGENRSLLAHANHPAGGKGAGNGEGMHDNQKKKDVFRPSLLDMETGRRDRWRDEERDTHPPTRKDRWRDGDKELSDTRRMDRWAENLSSRHTGEARRAPSERWSDSGNRDSNYDHRRESKWNTRWGPDDKDIDNTHDNLVDSGKDGDMPLDKGLPNLPIHGKDEKEGEPYRSWRSNPSQSRWKGEPTHQQIPNKQFSTFSYGRGRGENTHSTFLSGRGRGISTGNPVGGTFSHHQTQGNVFDSGENGPGEGSPFRYSRTKLLDLYRKIDMRACIDFLDGFITVPSLTQDDPLEPLALCAPSPEEMAVLRGIDKGDIASSGAPQMSKDGSTGRTSMDFSQPRRSRIGSREDLQHADDYRDESASNLKDVYANSNELPHERNRGYHDNSFNVEGREDFVAYGKVEDIPVIGESILPGCNSTTPATLWQGSSFGEQSHMVPHEQRDIVNSSRSRIPDISWSQTQNDAINLQESNVSNMLNIEDETRWRASDSSMIKRQLSGVLDKETEARKLSQAAPEDLLLYYKDPQGETQGPFTGIDIIGWFDAGYFGIDLEVRLASAPKDFPFSSLGDVMPHLRAKARPPPGFGVSKQGESVDASGRSASNSFGMAHTGVTEIDMSRSELRFKQGSTMEAQNRFLESLMSGTMSSPPQGFHGYVGNNSGVPPSGSENASDLYHLSQRMALEKQRSLPNSFPYWHGRDAASMIPKSEIIPETPLHRAKLIPPMMDNTVQSQSQSTDLMAILQGLGGRSDAGVNNGVGGWSNFPVQGGLDTMQDKIELLNSQKFSPQPSIGVQQQRLSSQVGPLTNLLGQAIDASTGILPQEKLASSGLAQDQQLLNLLQQQYLMQLQSQAPVQPQQLSLLDKLLLLKQQQQKQEEQQQLFRQQQLLSQVLSEHQSMQRFGEASYGLASAGLPVRNAPVDPSQLEPSQDLFQVGSKIPVPTTLEELPAGFNNRPAQVGLDVSLGGSSAVSSFHLPHQIFGNLSQKEGQSSTVAEHIIDGKNQEPVLASGVSKSLPFSESIKLSSHDPLVDKQQLASSHSNFVQEQPSEDIVKSNISCPSATSQETAGKETIEPPESSASLAARTNKPETSVNDHVKAETVQPSTVVDREEIAGATPLLPELKSSEVKEVKKVSEKKSRKQKSGKSQSSDQAKGVSQASSVSLKKSGAEESVDSNINAAGKSLGVSSQKAKDTKPEVPTSESFDSQDSHSSLSASILASDAAVTEVKVESGFSAFVQMKEPAAHSMQRAWKPAPGVKPKSLLEIQQEEQMKSQTDATAIEISSSVSSSSLSTPWAGIVASTDTKALADGQRVEGVSHISMTKTVVAESINLKKNPLHDILAEEVLAKSGERETENSGVSPLLSTQVSTTHVEPIDDNNFIEAKETKKSRKRSAKAKCAAAKAPVSISPDVSLGTSPVEKGKSSRVLQQEKEVLPAIPSGPSLGDFVPWKGESVNAAPAPAWSTDCKKVPKANSLREILKEQEKRSSSAQPQNQIPVQKLQSVEVTHNGDPSWSISASPAKAASPVRINSLASVQSKHKADDDLFWGPIDQAKQDTKQANFPLLANVGGWGPKSSPIKGNASLSRQKSTGSKPLERVLSSSPSSTHSTGKGRKGNMTKQSEAMDFRDWCESECARLIGSTDTSFLEFCLKQSRAEAEILLVENLGSFDPNHEFIEKFLDYKDLLPADVLEIAFHTRNDRKVTGFGATEMKSETNGAAGESDPISVDGSSKGAGKKKGKKGKKVSPSVLGFNVVSNRIMMGEIQTVEE